LTDAAAAGWMIDRHAMIEQNDAVGDVFFQAFTRQCTFPSFCCDVVVTPFFFSSEINGAVQPAVFGGWAILKRVIR